jgi:RNA polymerase sigma factor (sigma-70 family)
MSASHPSAPKPPFDAAAARQEDELFLRWREGDRRAGNQLVRVYDPRLRVYFQRRFTGDVRDLVQRTWLALTESRLRFRLDCAFRYYCLATARNISYEEIRRRRRVVLPLTQLEIVADRFDFVEHVLAVELTEQLETALRELDSLSAEVLQLFYWERLCGRRIGVQLGILESTVRGRIRRARERVRERMVDCTDPQSSRAILD